MFTKEFWKQALERAVKSGAQAVILAWGLLDGVLNAFAIDWKNAAGIFVGGAVLSILTSVASLAVGPDGTPSVVD